MDKKKMTGKYLMEKNNRGKGRAESRGRERR